MATPLTAAGAYANIAKITSGLAKQPGDSSNGSFSQVLKQAFDAVQAAGQKSDTQSVAVAKGQGNMVDVVTSVAETETAINAVVAVRDKVIAAYEDILKMPI